MAGAVVLQVKVVEVEIVEEEYDESKMVARGTGSDGQVASGRNEVVKVLEEASVITIR